jgi:hypothetical protein
LKIFDVTGENFKFKRIASVALVLMCLDAFVIGIPALGLLICFLLVVTSSILCLWFLFKEKKISILYAKKTSIYLCSIVVIILVFKTNVQIGKRNARILISAIDDYYENIGDYPNKLENLVPQYIEHIPICAYRLSDYRYRYVYSGGSHFLMWQEAPPFGHRIYHFKNAEWSYID